MTRCTFFCSLVKLRTLFAISCFRTTWGFARMKKKFSPIALKLFLGAFHQISRLFFFCPVFFLYYYYSGHFFVLTGTISSETVCDAKKQTIFAENRPIRVQNRQVSFPHNPTLTHTTGLKMRVFPMVKDRF